MLGLKLNHVSKRAPGSNELSHVYMYNIIARNILVIDTYNSLVLQNLADILLLQLLSCWGQIQYKDTILPV